MRKDPAKLARRQIEIRRSLGLPDIPDPENKNTGPRIEYMFNPGGLQIYRLFSNREQRKYNL